MRQNFQEQDTQLFRSLAFATVVVFDCTNLSEYLISPFVFSAAIAITHARINVYWRKYWAFALSNFLLIVILIVAFIWFFTELNQPSGPSSNYFEPALVLLVTLTGLVSATRFSQLVLSSRIADPTLPIELLEDRTSSPWKPINHSFFKIEWTLQLSVGQQALVQELFPANRSITQKFWNRIDAWCGALVYEQLLEETGTRNFRCLRLFHKPVLIRLHPEVDLTSHIVRYGVLSRLREMQVFQALHYLQPLKPPQLEDSSCDTQVIDTLFSMNLSVVPLSPAGAPLGVMEVLPFFDCDTHFSGSNSKELRSVAKAFAKLQLALCQWSPPEEIVPHLLANPKNEQYRLDRSKLLNTWSKIEKSLATNQLREVERAEIGDWVLKVAEHRKASTTQVGFLLHDVHPHNVFCTNDECLLIYDYHWIGKWPHEYVVAFTLHRFVREMVQRRVSNHNDAAKVKELCRMYADEFLTAYQEDVGDWLLLQTDFRALLPTWIKDANLDKLLRALAYSLGLETDIAGRSTERLSGEVRKLVRFMREADDF